MGGRFFMKNLIGFVLCSIFLVNLSLSFAAAPVVASQNPFSEYQAIIDQVNKELNAQMQVDRGQIDTVLKNIKEKGMSLQDFENEIRNGFINATAVPSHYELNADSTYENIIPSSNEVFPVADQEYPVPAGTKGCPPVIQLGVIETNAVEKTLFQKVVTPRYVVDQDIRQTCTAPNALLYLDSTIHSISGASGTFTYTTTNGSGSLNPGSGNYFRPDSGTRTISSDRKTCAAYYHGS
jgi:hypothetical protein